MDAASNTGIENMREIIENARYKPILARTKVYIIDEVHMLSKSAFNGLLKTLEEPPEHVKFIFATTEIRKVPVTVLSRCQRFDLRRVDVPELSAHLGSITAKEGATADPDALAMIARAAGGSVRDGLSILDQAIAMGSGKVSADIVRGMLGLADRGRVFDLLEKLSRGYSGGCVEGVRGDPSRWRGAGAVARRSRGRRASGDAVQGAGRRGGQRGCAGGRRAPGGVAGRAAFHAAARAGVADAAEGHRGGREGARSAGGG